ncbi:TadE/TadG family type IV pilus assembly protein [Thalassotalea mangrovi]|uniref:Pilus assembly protein n=1 Tax=Thalassotalea mangrovi TaxID=2572245 RepID=A0A4U1B3E3_9GAMM|nr:TadE/TadG family type IV pilus assembly protein [Thalassotalea mangrovi]TKB44229.1 pilus assembly protein [Thalassotalea mangrovi]
MKTLTYKSRKNQQGVAAIELTIILPFFLLLFFATSEFGRLMYQYNALTKTVRDATRFATSHASPGTTGAVDLSQISNEINNIIKYGQLTPGTSLLPNVDQDGVMTIVVSESDDLITIAVTYYWQPIFADFIPGFFSDTEINLNFPISAQYTMRVIDV